MSQEFLRSILRNHIGSSCKLLYASFVSGGCINNTVKLETNQGLFFIKWKSNEPDLFRCEAHDLSILADKSPLRTPEVFAFGNESGKDFLLMEFLEKGRPSSSFWEDFGRNLALQHKQTNSLFGLNHNNHIGRLPQQNDFESDWVDFFIKRRIDPQLRLAVKQGFSEMELNDGFEALYSRLYDIFPNEVPALLHGDLWSGNFMIDSTGNASIFDPAVYYGHREMELAFTRMFGGFDQRFYEAYIHSWPLESGFYDRVDIYNLYPLLVHLNLFGSGYLNEILAILKRYAK